MAFADRRRQTSTTQGPPPLVLEPAVAGFKPLAPFYAVGVDIPISIVGYNSDLTLSGQWVVGVGHLDAGGLLHLDTTSDSDNFSGTFTSAVLEVFANMGAKELEDYVAGVVAAAVATALAGLSYTHVQSSSSSTWTINHNLGFRPVVTVLDDGNNEVEAEVIHVSQNQVQVFFNVATTGTARLA